MWGRTWRKKLPSAGGDKRRLRRAGSFVMTSLLSLPDCMCMYAVVAAAVAAASGVFLPPPQHTQKFLSNLQIFLDSGNTQDSLDIWKQTVCEIVVRWENWVIKMLGLKVSFMHRLLSIGNYNNMHVLCWLVDVRSGLSLWFVWLRYMNPTSDFRIAN